MSAINIENLDKLFIEVQLNGVFPDNKTFVDCSPKKKIKEIYDLYLTTKNNLNFDLKQFVLENFELPQDFSTGYTSDISNSPETHINNLWSVLTRADAENTPQSTLIELPFPYVVPGGRFGEIYYWDSYFTMLGLQTSGNFMLIGNMLDNFAYLIYKLGYIPNGNRTYFLGRSQPPFFALMVNILYEERGEEVLIKYLPYLEKEYAFWMFGEDKLNFENAHARVVKMPNGEVMNRYWDAHNTPRPESYKEDIELAELAENPAELWRNVRAACESGWDFSTRWFKNVDSFESIHTTEIIPVDLNCILLFLEQLLEKAYKITENPILEEQLNVRWQQRQKNIREYCWNNEAGFFCDFDFVSNKIKDNLTLAGVFPLFFNVATPSQAKQVAKNLEKQFLCSGGLLTTTEFSGQQWDAPNGWAPLQWIAYGGVKNYGFHKLANRIKSNWLKLNENVYENTGKFTEKYDVFHEKMTATGGEYPNQDGFGWTNGVYLKLLKSE